ncbi:MAG: hypothetical protein MR902_02870 [Campylobacter sp.]|nr:hypothetical protein [Campylobacter sp.]
MRNAFICALVGGLIGYYLVGDTFSNYISRENITIIAAICGGLLGFTH